MILQCCWSLTFWLLQVISETGTGYESDPFLIPAYPQHPSLPAIPLPGITAVGYVTRLVYTIIAEIETARNRDNDGSHRETITLITGDFFLFDWNMECSFGSGWTANAADFYNKPTPYSDVNVDSNNFCP